MKHPWFKRTCWSYQPTHAMGWLVTATAVIFMVPVTLAVVRIGHSATDNLYQLFVYATCTAFWWKWIADKTSVSRNRI